MSDKPLKRDVYRPTKIPVLKDPNDTLKLEWIMVPFDATPKPPGPEPEPTEELKFDQQPLCSGTGKPGRTLTGTMGTAKGGVLPYKPYKAKWRYKDPTKAGSWVDITDWSEDNPQEYVVKEEDVGSKINFFQRIEDAEGTAKQTGSSKDIIADDQPLKVVEKADWKDDNCYVVGCTVEARTATFEGGHFSQTTYRSRIQTRKTADDDWSNSTWTIHENEHIYITYTFDDVGQCRVVTQARDEAIEPVETVNSFASTKTVTAPPALVISEPVVSGEPWVGETLTCTEPTVTGGVGPFQFDYFWVDESNVIVWEAPKMQPNTTVTTYDIGKMMKCLVQVTDKGWKQGETATVSSNSIGPIGQRTIGNVVVTVDGSVVDGEEFEDSVETRTGQEHIILLTPDGNATGLKSDFTVRGGEARLSQTANSCIVTIQGLYPGSVHIQCKIEDRNTVEGEFSQRVVFVIAE